MFLISFQFRAIVLKCKQTSLCAICYNRDFTTYNSILPPYSYLSCAVLFVCCEFAFLNILLLLGLVSDVSLFLLFFCVLTMNVKLTPLLFRQLYFLWNNQFYREAWLTCSLYRPTEDIWIVIYYFKRGFNEWHMLKKVCQSNNILNNLWGNKED